MCYLDMICSVWLSTEIYFLWTKYAYLHFQYIYTVNDRKKSVQKDGSQRKSKSYSR